jgi:hypothetical protein
VGGWTNSADISPLLVRNNSMYSTSHGNCSEGSEQWGLAARRPQPSCPLVLDLNAGGVVMLLTFWKVGKWRGLLQRSVGVSYTRRSVVQNVLHASNRPRVLAVKQSVVIEVSCILKSRLKHRPFSNAVDEQLARWLVLAVGGMDVRCGSKQTRREGNWQQGRG